MSRTVPRFDITCPCGVVFQIKDSQRSRKKYCSNDCRYRFYQKRSGYTRVDKQPCPSWFRNGHESWSKGTKGVMKPNAGSFKNGERRSIGTEFTSERTARDSNVNWKGDAVGYFALHSWVYRILGKATECAHCGNMDRRIDWANKSGDYKRNVEDWIQLCSTCHGAYDSGSRRGAIKRRFGACA